MSRSPSWNQVSSSPSSFAVSIAFQVSSAAAPATVLVVQVGERVEQAVEIRRDVQSEHLGVVADVADHRHFLGADQVGEAAHEARAADTTG